MSSAPFDTHAAVKRLSAAGFSEAQAEALISALSRGQEDLVTKTDIRDMVTKGDLRDMATKGDIRDMATKGDLKDLEIRFIKWMFGLILPLYAIQIAVLLALLF